MDDLQLSYNIRIAVLHSSAAEDSEYVSRLKVHLGLLERKYRNLRIWTFEDVLPGEEAELVVHRELRQADIVLMLLSIDFISDSFIDGHTRALLQRYSRCKPRERQIIPVVLRHVHWQDAYDDAFDIENLAVVSKPVSASDDLDEAIVAVVEKMEQCIEILDASSITIAIPTWVGYISGILYNGGFNKSTETSLFREFNRTVKFEVNDDLDSLLDAWKAGEIDLIWATLDRLPEIAEELKETAPKVIFQTSWSTGADAIVARKHIGRVEDLRGKKVLYLYNSVSKYFLTYVLQEAGMTIDDIHAIPEMNIRSPELLIKQFLENEDLDAVVLWSPFIESCIHESDDVFVLIDSNTYPRLITDVLLARREFIELNKEELIELFRGWFEQVHHIRIDDEQRKQAITILAKAIMNPIPKILPNKLRLSIQMTLEDFFSQALEKTELCTFEDNQRFFTATGDQISEGEKTYAFYAKTIEQARGKKVLPWESLYNDSIIQAIGIADK